MSGLTTYIGVLLVDMLLLTPGQWLNCPTPNTPHGADGKPSLSAKTPKMYTKPFTINVTEVLLQDTDILESVCNENEKDLQHLDTDK